MFTQNKHFCQAEEGWQDIIQACRKPAFQPGSHAQLGRRHLVCLVLMSASQGPVKQSSGIHHPAGPCLNWGIADSICLGQKPAYPSDSRYVFRSVLGKPGSGSKLFQFKGGHSVSFPHSTINVQLLFAQ